MLDISARLWSDGYEEHLVVDADTGIPLRAGGGYPGTTPTVVTTYTVERIDTATLGRGHRAPVDHGRSPGTRTLGLLPRSGR